MEHFVVQILGTLLLPVLLIAILASMVGLKPESLLMPLFALIGVIFKLILDIAIVLTRIVGGALLVAIARVFNVR